MHSSFLIYIILHSSVLNLPPANPISWHLFHKYSHSALALTTLSNEGLSANSHQRIYTFSQIFLEYSDYYGTQHYLKAISNRLPPLWEMTV